MAHYAEAPTGYCVEHGAWFNTIEKCAAATDTECVDGSNTPITNMWVCASDGNPLYSITIVATIPIEERQYAARALAANHPGFDITGQMDKIGTGQWWNSHLDKCDKCSNHVERAKQADSEDPADITAATPPPLSTVLEDNPELGKQVASSIQKTAIWYFMKPRWIMRRKQQAIIRRKVRSIFSPVTMKNY
jgi:hypothetical protein